MLGINVAMIPLTLSFVKIGFGISLFLVWKAYARKLHTLPAPSDPDPNPINPPIIDPDPRN